MRSKTQTWNPADIPSRIPAFISLSGGSNEETAAKQIAQLDDVSNVEEFGQLNDKFSFTNFFDERNLHTVFAGGASMERKAGRRVTLGCLYKSSQI
jgi:hypothetical protein